MKKDYLLRVACLTVMMIVSVLAHPQVYRVNNPSGQLGKYSFSSQFSQIDLQSDKMLNGDVSEMTMVSRHLSPRKADGDVTLSLQFDYDPNEFFAPWMARLIKGQDVQVIYTTYGSNVTEVSVSPGVYDIVVSFSKNNEPYFVVKENVDVTEDVTVVLDPTESVNKLAFTHYAPDGSQFKHALVEYDENWNMTELEPGDVTFTAMLPVIYLKGVGPVGSSMVFFSGGQTEEDMRIPRLDYYINDVSDRFVMTQMQISGVDNTWYMSYISTNDPKSGNLSNDVANYHQTQETYQYTPYGMEMIGTGSLIQITSLYDGMKVDMNSVSSFNEDQKTDEMATYTIVSDMPYQDPYDEKIAYLMAPGFIDYGAVMVESWGSYLKYFKTQGMPFAFIDGEKTNVAVPHINSDNQVTPLANVMTPAGEVVSQMLPDNDAFSCPFSECDLIIGGTTPINAVLVQNHGPLYGEYGTGGLRPYYVGQLGELRDGDESFAYVFATFNGEAIPDITTWEANEDGAYEVTYINDNIMVESLQGNNETTLHFDQRLDDATPPALQMLQLKNADGIVTNRFGQPQDGVLYFAAGDFNQSLEMGLNQWSLPFDHDMVARVMVEYSPNDVVNWSVLADDLAPASESTLGWGFLYTLSLDGVDAQSGNNWFDLRITLQDAAGNWQQQVISPAFCIKNEDGSAIQEIGVDNAGDHAIYDLQGRRYMSLDGLSRGIYIVNGKKVLVK